MIHAVHVVHNIYATQDVEMDIVPDTNKCIVSDKVMDKGLDSIMVKGSDDAFNDLMDIDDNAISDVMSINDNNVSDAMPIISDDDEVYCDTVFSFYTKQNHSHLHQVRPTHQLDVLSSISNELQCLKL